MKTYTIYHINGVKIGCTSDLNNRMRAQGFTDWEVLEEHTDIYEVSNREMELQREYSLPVDTVPYYISVRNRLRATIAAHTPEANRKRSYSMRGNTSGLGYKHTDETKRIISEANKGNSYGLGYKHTEEALRKISDSNKGKVFSEETKLKMSEAQKGKPQRKVPCPKCGKLISLSNMSRHIGRKIPCA